jgi:hypothetical protein
MNCKTIAKRSFRSARASRQVIEIIGGRTRTRTLDPLIKSQLLYQLSYAPLCVIRAGRVLYQRDAGLSSDSLGRGTRINRRRA